MITPFIPRDHQVAANRNLPPGISGANTMHPRGVLPQDTEAMAEAEARTVLIAADRTDL